MIFVAEIVDESQCNMRGPITVSSDASEISYYVAVAVSP